MSNKLKVINLWAGPGAGKSTTMALIFGTLKKRGINCEMAPEWIKWAAWENRQKVFEEQGYILQKQNWMLHRLKDKVEIAISDSPLALCTAYSYLYDLGPYSTETWRNHCFNVFNTYDNFNVFIERTKPYNGKGRNQSEDDAKKLDSIVLETLQRHNVPFITVRDGDTTHLDIIEMYEKENGKIKKYFE